MLQGFAEDDVKRQVGPHDLLLLPPTRLHVLQQHGILCILTLKSASRDN